MTNNLLKILNVKVIGNGDSILVFAHGFGTDQSAWRSIIPFFSPNYQIVLYDLIFAGSVNPDYFDFRRYTSLEAYVDDLLNILDALHIEECAYIGHSISAMIGILASIRRPDLFTNLILIGASPSYLNDRDYRGGFDRVEVERIFTAMEANYEEFVNGFAPWAIGADVPAAVREFTRTLYNMRPDVPAAVREFTRNLLNMRPAVPEDVREFRRTLLNQRPNISVFVSRMVFERNLRGVLGQVRVPCCIIQSAKDMAVPVSVAKYLMNHLGGRNTSRILNTEGHLPHLTAPTIVVQNIRRALSVTD